MPSRVASLLGGVLLAAMLAACTGTPASQQTGSPSPPSLPASGGPNVTGGTVPRPSLQEQPDGSAVAFGWVARQSIEGGFWSLVDAQPSAGTTGAVVCVLLPGAVKEPGIAALDGSYVRVTGDVRKGVSIRMSGPEVTIETIQKLTDQAP